MSRTQTNGYTCPTCGVWCPYGSSHSCAGYPGLSNLPPPSLPDQTDRLINAIERLIAALEKQAK